MNWKEINDRYPKAFLEWIRVYMKDKYITSAVVENFTVRLGYELSGFSYSHINRMDEEVYKLPFYFDTLGIEIESSTYKCLIIDRTSKSTHFVDYNLGHKDRRLSATIAGAEKAFEIREIQLNEQENE